jgi:hypothetical protein
VNASKSESRFYISTAKGRISDGVCLFSKRFVGRLYTDLVVLMWPFSIEGMMNVQENNVDTTATMNIILSWMLLDRSAGKECRTRKHQNGLQG